MVLSARRCGAGQAYLLGVRSGRGLGTVYLPPDDSALPRSKMPNGEV